MQARAVDGSFVGQNLAVTAQRCVKPGQYERFGESGAVVKIPAEVSGVVCRGASRVDSGKPVWLPVGEVGAGRLAEA